MGVVAQRLMAVVVVGMMMITVLGARSILLDSFTWEDCSLDNSTSTTVHVQKLNVTSPLPIPGQVTIKELQMELDSPLPDDVIIQFKVYKNSTFGPQYPAVIPCFPHDGGSCAYRLCDLVKEQSSRVTQQIVGALNISQCPISGPANITLREVTINIPHMIASPLDTFINTNNYYVTVTLLSGNDTLGCLKASMPVHKTCLGWLCPKPIDQVLAEWSPGS